MSLRLDHAVTERASLMMGFLGHVARILSISVPVKARIVWVRMLRLS
jgi:hypothetical protein